MDFDEDSPLINLFIPPTTCGCAACQESLNDVQRSQYQEWRLEQDRINEEQARRDAENARRQREEERRRQTEVECTTCHSRHPRRSTYALPGDQRGCTTCYQRCSNCRAVHLRTDMQTVRDVFSGETLLCDNCMGTCTECENQYPRQQLYGALDEDGRFCQECTHYCDYCGNRFVESHDCDYFESRSGTGRGVMGYGKTHAKHFLGGPTRKSEMAKDQAYYLGFELEISSSDETDSDVRPVYEWAQENLGFSDGLDCKSDSSVDGFEIATQPMTPEFFEGLDWDSFFEVLNENYRIYRSRPEPTGHGLHVHISRTAFADDVALAAFCYLINQDGHMERIARRSATTYCKKVDKPVSHAIKKVNSETGKFRRQAAKSTMRDIYLDRNAINLLNSKTVEIRAFRSTRKAEDLKAAMRLVYVSAEYIRYLRKEERSISPKALHWSVFSQWVLKNYPAAYEAISGKETPVLADA